MRSGRRRLLVILPVAAGLSIALVSSALAGGVSVRDSVYGKGSSTVRPSSGLGDNQFVKVSWRGFGPLQVVFFRQCTAHPASVSKDCTAIYSDPGFTNAGGSGALYQHVSEGDVRSESGRTFRCDDRRPCSFGVFTGASLRSGTLRPLHFAPTPAGCPAPSGAAIAGGGANQANHAMFGWGVQICQPPDRLGVNYIPANSQDGLNNFVNGLNDFAVTGMPFSADQLTALHAAGKSVQYAPITTSGLVVAYKIFNQDPAHSAPGAQISNLKLTPQLVAKIFTGQISNWHTDPEITALNPGDVFPPLVRPLVRGDHSVANFEFTSWLTAQGGSGLPSDWPGAGTDYPLNYLTQNAGIVGGDALADAIADPASVQNNNDYFSDGYIGFVDSSEAAYYGLPVARIQNAAGKFVKATPASLTAALKDAKPGAGGLLVPDYSTTDAKAYPMPFVSYVTAPTSGISDARGTTLRGFLHYVITAGRKRVPAGYLPLPASLAAKTASVIGKIPGTTPVVSTGGSGAGGGYGGGGGGGSYPAGGSGGPPDLGTSPPPPGGGDRGSTSPPASGPAQLPAATLAASAGRLVLPSLIGLGLAGVLGGLMLLGAGGWGGRLAGWAGRLSPPWRLRP
jgi:phosphate transport system substrate-binding protein